MKFVPRKTAPSKNDEHYYGNGNPYVKGGYGMPNCTTYAIGRFWEVCGSLLEPLKSKGYDSTTVFYHCKNDSNSQYKNLLGQEPKVGAIACWSSVKNDVPSNKGTHGHLAAVEEVLSNGDFIGSNSAYKGTNFYMKTYSKKNNYTFTTGRTYYLQGFIYPPITFDDDKPNPEPTPTPTPEPVKQDFKVGDKVVVTGYATSDSFGGTSKTAKYTGSLDEPRYITKITDLSRPRPYHISVGNKLGDRDRGWVSKDQIKKI